MEALKEKNIIQGLELAHTKALKSKKSILFSHTFQFDVRDVLPLLTHPADKHKTRIYWEQPYSKLSFAAIGNIKEFNICNNIDDLVQFNIKPNYSRLSSKVGSDMKNMISELSNISSDVIIESFESDVFSRCLNQLLKKPTLVTNVPPLVLCSCGEEYSIRLGRFQSEGMVSYYKYPSRKNQL